MISSFSSWPNIAPVCIRIWSESSILISSFLKKGLGIDLLSLCNLLTVPDPMASTAMENKAWLSSSILFPLSCLDVVFLSSCCPLLQTLGPPTQVFENWEIILLDPSSIDFHKAEKFVSVLRVCFGSLSKVVD